MKKQINVINTIIISLLLTFFALSKSPLDIYRTHPRDGIHKELQYYVVKFEAVGKIVLGDTFKIPDIDVDFGNAKFTASKAVGWCRTNTSFKQKPKILVDVKWWKTASIDEKEIMLFHELAHCVLLRDHETRKTESLDIPLSIMYPSVLPGVFYKHFRTYYLYELFTGLNDSITRYKFKGPL